MDAKLSKEQMILEIREELVNYLRRGIINPKSFFTIKHTSFSDLNDILKIHFILSKEVRDYVLSLEKSLRNLRTSSRLQTDLFTGEVRGQIDYEQTLSYRLNHNPKDKSRFVGIVNEKMFDTRKNKVLKKLLSLLYDIIDGELGMKRFEGFKWFKDGEEIRNIVSSVYRENVYLKRIDASRVSDKMIEDVSRHRNKLYRDSACLLKLYKRVMNKDQEEMGRLFSNTFIELEDEDTVFELYSIFKYIREHFPKDKVRYKVLDGKEKSIVEITDREYRYEVYHNSTGRDEISFNIDKSEIEKSENEFLKKKIRILKDRSRLYSELEKGRPSTSIWRGRPDLLILKFYKEDLVEITIGEAKYTNSRTYMHKGIEELLEYMHFIKFREEELNQSIKLTGLLFVDNIELDKREFENITIVSRY